MAKATEIVLYCPFCGNNKMGRSALAGSGHQRWKCKGCNRRTTQPLLQPPSDIDEDKEQRPPLNTYDYYEKLTKYIAKHSTTRFVITSAQNATPIYSPFFNTLLNICKRTDAKLIVIPYRYHNPTSVWSKKDESLDWWAQEIQPYLLEQNLLISNNLVMLGEIKTQPTAVNPTSGFETITGGKSAIIGHPKLELVSIPTPQQKMAKIFTTTGAVTKPNYTTSKAGKKGEFHHTYAATFVEATKDKFFLYQLVATVDGRIMHLDTEYLPDGKTKKIQPLGLVMGDTHQEFVDPGVMNATFIDNDSMVKALKPKYLIWHDVHDFYSRNHHHEGRIFINYAKHLSNRDDVEKALDETYQFLDRYSPSSCNNIFVPSNHPDALARWIERNADHPGEDPKNLVFWAKTFQAMAEGTKMTESRSVTIDPFEYWARSKMKCYSRSVFLKRDQSFRLQGVEVAYHGDQGSNGSRGNIRGFGKIGTRSIIGHSHTPGIKDGVYQVGTSSFLALEYNKGPSSWMHCHGIIYPNGKRSLLFIVDGDWRV